LPCLVRQHNGTTIDFRSFFTSIKTFFKNTKKLNKYLLVSAICARGGAINQTRFKTPSPLPSICLVDLRAAQLYEFLNAE
jgi:hypothetical protein